MVDTTALPGSQSGAHTSTDARKRLRARYRFEFIFQALGIFALALAGMALATLLYTIVDKAARALTETYIVLDVPPSRTEIDPKLTNDARVIRRGDFSGVVKESLRSTFPTIQDRREKLTLYKITSDAAALELREQAMANPALLDQKRSVELLASDDVHLWNAGSEGELLSLPSSGTATPIVSGGDVKIVAESNAFQPLLARIKEQLEDRASLFQRQADAQQRGVVEFQRRLDSVEAGGALATQYAERITAYENARNSFLDKRDAVLKRASTAGGEEAADSFVPSYLIYINGGVVKAKTVTVDSITGPALLPLATYNPAAEGLWEIKKISTSEASRNVSDRQIAYVEQLRTEGRIKETFNWRFFSSGDSREAEIAGVWGAAVGSFWTMMVTFVLSFPIGVMAAIYLEEFAPKNRITAFIEVNINNLAAVPSIVFGLLGLAVFINFLGVPRSAPLVGGMVLALMTLPTIIIAARAAIKAVPPSIREAALGVGASKVQTTFHHVLPLAMPGILTGTIIGMAQALGETAPLLMIGMVAFIVDVPNGILDPATVLPVQIYRWSDFPERAFELRTAAAIGVLLCFLIIMNILAVILRKRFERRW